MDKEIEHIVDTIWQDKNTQDNSAEIEGLKKMRGKVAKGMDDLTKRIATLEQLV